MLVHPEKRGQNNVRAFIETLKAMAGGKPVSKPSKRPPSGRRKVEKPVAPKREKPTSGEVARGTRSDRRKRRRSPR